MSVSTINRPRSTATSLLVATVLLLSIIYCLSISCSTRDPKFQQYFVQGQVLYEKHCSNCHQKNGQGLGRLYPPLALSDFLKNNVDKSMCIMKYGIQGEITVNGQSYGRIGETDAVLVDHGKVSVKRADSRGQSSK